MHAIKFQYVVTANRVIANLYGPVEGYRHDSGKLAYSCFLQQQEHDLNFYQESMCLYGDSAYPLRVHLQGLFPNPILEQLKYNKTMSQAHVEIEYVFSNISNFFAFLDFEKNLKIGISFVGKIYTCCALMQNTRNCLYGCMTSIFFQWTIYSMDYFQ